MDCFFLLPRCLFANFPLIMAFTFWLLALHHVMQRLIMISIFWETFLFVRLLRGQNYQNNASSLSNPQQQANKLYLCDNRKKKFLTGEVLKFLKHLDSTDQKRPNPSCETIPFCDVGGMGEHAVGPVPRSGRRAQHGEEPGPWCAAPHRQTASRSRPGTRHNAHKFIFFLLIGWRYEIWKYFFQNVFKTLRAML